MNDADSLIKIIITAVGSISITVAGIVATSWFRRRNNRAEAKKTDAEASAVKTGETVDVAGAWRELLEPYRQEVQLFRTKVQDAEQRAERAEERAERAETRLSEMEHRFDRLEDRVRQAEQLLDARQIPVPWRTPAPPPSAA